MNTNDSTSSTQTISTPSVEAAPAVTVSVSSDAPSVTVTVPAQATSDVAVAASDAVAPAVPSSGPVAAKKAKSSKKHNPIDDQEAFMEAVASTGSGAQRTRIRKRYSELAAIYQDLSELCDHLMAGGKKRKSTTTAAKAGRSKSKAKSTDPNVEKKTNMYFLWKKEYTAANKDSLPADSSAKVEELKARWAAVSDDEKKRLKVRADEINARVTAREAAEAATSGSGSDASEGEEAPVKAKKGKKTAKKAKVEEASEEEASDDEEEVAPKKTKKTRTAKKATKSSRRKSRLDESDEE